MISILIPTFNYNAFPLVEELYRQVNLEKIAFEIIVLDDASPINENNALNTKINALEHCHFERNTSNLGRSGNRNALALKARYPWLLFMDCDTFPKNDDFIQQYLKSIKTASVSVVFGGICYQEQQPNDTEMLRWVFGKKREDISLEKRIQNPYENCLISNIFLHNSVFDSIEFDPSIVEYGYEDVLFVLNLKLNAIPILHISNPAYHLNLESSKIFVEKFYSSLNNLKKLVDTHKIKYTDTALTTTFFWIKRMQLVPFSAFLFDLFKNVFERNLYSKKPSLFLFDLYRLGYFCKLNK